MDSRKVSTCNPFFNFLKHFRRHRKSWSNVKLAIEAARRWREMSQAERQAYARTRGYIQQDNQKRKIAHRRRSTPMPQHIDVDESDDDDDQHNTKPTPKLKENTPKQNAKSAHHRSNPKGDSSEDSDSATDDKSLQHDQHLKKHVKKTNLKPLQVKRPKNVKPRHIKTSRKDKDEPMDEAHRCRKRRKIDSYNNEVEGSEDQEEYESDDSSEYEIYRVSPVQQELRHHALKNGATLNCSKRTWEMMMHDFRKQHGKQLNPGRRVTVIPYQAQSNRAKRHCYGLNEAGKKSAAPPAKKKEAPAPDGEMQNCVVPMSKNCDDTIYKLGNLQEPPQDASNIDETISYRRW